jgi:hypothetical protein
MTVVKSLNSGDPDVSVLPDIELADLQMPDINYSGLSNFQMQFGLHPSAVHVCSCMFM